MSDAPHIKFESPAETLVDSFASTPANYSLFSDSMDMSAHSYDDDSMFGDGSMAGTPAPEKKPVKKRKSWGQQLPEPKTNLPPRKRAKTEDEKEQRRVERVLRNRRAAQSSRERKRQEVEALENEKKAIEQRNQDLEMRLAEMAAQNALLQQQIQQITGGNMRVFQGSSVASSPAAERVRTPAPVTFSQDLFGSRETDHRVSISSQPLTDSRTVNPASLSPEIRPVAESTNASSSDMTQHPAAMLCDLQCQSEEQRPWNTASTTLISQLLAITLLINMTSTTISTLLSPLNQIVSCLKTGSSLPSTPSILNLIIWLVTTTTSLRTSTSTISSTKTTSSGPRFSLRIRLLRRLLACSPNLARPLMDATMVAMRSASEQQLFHSRISGNEGNCQGENRSPSVESLMTLLWAIRVISKEERSERDIPKLDVAMEIRQVCEELDGMFRRDEGLRRDTHSLSFEMTDTGITGKSQKSLGGGRTAYP